MVRRLATVDTDNGVLLPRVNLTEENLPDRLDEAAMDAAYLRYNATAVGLYGVTPVAQAAAIATPTAPGATYSQTEAQSMKTAIDALRTALKNVGITA